MKWFRKEERSDDFVDLSIGRYYFRVLSNKIRCNAEIRSTIIKDTLNNALFFSLIEQSLLIIPKKLFNKLSIEDGDKVRDKTREILIRHGIISPIEKATVEEEQKNFFSQGERNFNLYSSQN